MRRQSQEEDQKAKLAAKQKQELETYVEQAAQCEADFAARWSGLKLVRRLSSALLDITRERARNPLARGSNPFVSIITQKEYTRVQQSRQPMKYDSKIADYD